MPRKQSDSIPLFTPGVTACQYCREVIAKKTELVLEANFQNSDCDPYHARCYFEKTAVNRVNTP